MTEIFNLTYRFNKYYYDLCEPALQYDTGQKLKINNLPSNCEAHWVYDNIPNDIDVDIRQFNNSICNIPDMAFLSAGTAICYLFQITETKVETIAEIRMNVRPRPKPENYVTSDDAVRLKDIIDSAMKEIDYTKLKNKPLINSVELSGNKSLEDLDIQEEMSEFTNTEILKIWNEH